MSPSTSDQSQSQSSIHSAAPRWLRLAGVLALAIVMLMVVSVAFFGAPYLGIQAGSSSGGLTITILSAPNLVVDSNVLAPSTYAPKVATVAGKFCNTNGYTLNDVMGYIGDYKGGSSPTPGVYPVRTGAFLAQYPWASSTDVYSLTHIGGRLGTLDGARYIGDIPAGECKYQYWSFGYPQTNPAHTSAVWGETRLTSDDLSLRFDVWGAGTTGVSADASFTVTMRNEISAMANKIQPNPDGMWFNTDTSRVLPGQMITSNGVLYSFGVINQGFDADSNFTPDFDAWMQPIGDPSYDPSCFRLVKTSGVLTITRGAGNPDYIEPFTDKLYFSNLPQDNTGGIGNVYYTFVALNGPCATALTPYQEVASGSENEKFNGDYGASVPPPGGYTPAVTITKGGTTFVDLGGLITYTVKLKNNGTSAAGLPLYGMPAVISDAIPPGTALTAGSIFSDTSMKVLYSIDHGVTWSSVAPSPLSLVTNVQFWLSDTLAPSGTLQSAAQVTFTLQMTTTPPAKPYVTNCADEQFGSGSPFGTACKTTYLNGPYQGGHYTWRDENRDQVRQVIGEAYIPYISSTLYYDLNGNQKLDASDPVISQTQTGSGGFYTYTNLYTGTYIVLVDKNDGDIPYGYRATTPITHLLTVSSGTPDYGQANFGFGPTLTFTKKLQTPIYDHGYAYYDLSVTNLRPGGGDTVNNSCRYTVWAGGQDAANTGTGQKTWTNIQNAFGAPDGAFAHAPYANAAEKLALTGWNLSVQPGSVVTVDMILPILMSNNTTPDKLDISVITATGGTVSATAQYVLNTFGSGNLIIKDIAHGMWTWTDFSGSNRSIVLLTTKAPGTNLNFNLDAAGFYVYSDKPCADAAPDDIMTTVPLTDTYDTGKLLFVSAVPAYTSIDQATGVISWTNVGPIAPGETKDVKVTFLVSDVSVATQITNTACTIGTTFSDGGSANNGCGKAIGTITPTGIISGVVWNDANTNNWQGTTGYDASDFKIPNVNVTLFVCQGTGTVNEGVLVPAGGSTTNRSCPAQGSGPNATDWVTVTQQTTDQNGGYLFTGLLDGWYAVKIDTTTTPLGFAVDAAATGLANGAGASCATAGTCQTWANDYTNANLNPTTYAPVSGHNTIAEVNFGYVGGALIYGTIWQDFNGDGAHQSTDYGLDNSTSGVTVTLYKAGVPISTTQTDPNGYYSFPNLASAAYSVTVTTGLPTDGGTWTQTAQGVNWGSACTGCSGVQTLTVNPGEIKGSYDFGYHRSGPVNIGDTVYYDWNGDGVQQPNEAGIPTVTLKLYRDINANGMLEGSDSLVSMTTTSLTGYYLFTGIPTRTTVVTYFVVVDTLGADFPLGVWQTGDPDEVGPCQVCNSTGRAEILTSNVLNMDFGYQPYGWGAIGDTVYRDMDGDGIQSGVMETGIPSVMVWLEVDLIGGGNYLRVMTTTTDSTGYYLFPDLPDADYRVVVDSASAYLPKDGAGQSYIPSTPTVYPTTLTSADPIDLDADFGFMPLGAIGDTIYWDANGNAQQDWAETGISSVLVTLTLPTGGQLFATTNVTGTYLFAGLEPGTYTVTVGPIPGNPTLTGDPDTNGTPCPISSGPLAGYCDGKTSPKILTGTIFLGADFGYQPLGVIGDFVFQDQNGNGLQDTGEPGIPGVVVTVTPPSGVDLGKGSGAPITTTTDLDGLYSFSNLPVSHDYTVTFQTPISMTSSAVNTAYVAGTGNVGTSITVTMGITQVTAIGGLTCTNCSLNVDSGFTLAGSRTVSGHVFFDAGNDGGVFTPTHTITPDLPYAGIVVYLYDSSNKQIGFTTTDASGAYTFTNLPSGNYTVSYDPASPKLTNLTQTASPSNPTGKCGPCLNYYLSPGGFTVTTTDVANLDFGFYAGLDFGDLPSSYNLTKLSNEGPRHITSGLYLGAGVSTEGDGQESPTATGDTFDDGVSRDMTNKWTPGATVSLFVTVTGGTGYLVGWFDWNKDGDFADAGEQITKGSIGLGNSQTWSIVVPGTYITQTLINARFRLYNGQPLQASPQGAAVGGEVEDYQWNFGPTAVTLSEFSARASGAAPLALLPIFLIVAVAWYAAHRRLRRRAA